jgi:subtilisin family serine protease
VVYVHGIGNKPPPALLKRSWDHALFGRDMGARTAMAYWADVRYPQPLPSIDAERFATASAGAGPAAPRDAGDPADAIDTPGAEAAAYARAVAARLAPAERGPARRRGPGATAARTRVLPLPAPLRRWITERILRAFLRDTAAYFYDRDQRAAMQRRLRDLLVPEGGPYVVVAHSQGSIIAHDVLGELPRAVAVDLLVTMGSPLGITEVQDHLRKPLRVPAAVAAWRNFADPLDPVALDGSLAGEFAPRGRIADETVVNRDTLRGFDPHSGTGYLATAEVQAAVRDAVGAHFARPLPDFVIARDVAAEMADAIQRHPVLIELDEVKDPAAGAPHTLAHRAERVAAAIEKVVPRDEREDAAVDVLRRYVAAKLTAAEITRLAADHAGLGVRRIWRNARKHALITQSAHVVQAYTARIGYRATGKGIAWAVLDTGIQADHPHFAGRIAALWDCTRRGQPVRAAGRDPDGHGTHVSGIIAGRSQVEGVEHAGMAPEATLHAYQVLDADGGGEDAWIIKALDHIAQVNESGPGLTIHGVNLSLGGPFDPEVYGCGHSPICRELRRLWRQGVVVCVAAGNEGRAVIQTAEGEQEISLDLSIGDPANLEEAIAVGSVHRDSPHLYGISYFSSRGPTADGRAKPDLVAPGEKIVSCNSDFRKARPKTHYVALSGTSMACPHVSGLVAAFLSVRREFIGHPDQLKAILLAHCTDLKRDRYHQGAGMPNLVRMLAET